MSEQREMTDQNKAIMRRLHEEIINKGNLEAFDEILAVNVVEHRGSLPDLKGVEACKQYVAGLRGAFPDLRFTIDQMIAEGNLVVAQFTMTGTHQGPAISFPIAPTGKPITTAGCKVVRLVDGRIIEMWTYTDLFGMMQQLGVLPPPKQATA